MHNEHSPLPPAPTATHWQNIGTKNHHGINIPLFSLHSKQSCGIGEYPDLLPIIEWCTQIRFDVIQLLPINDTGNENSPYCAISANALNPIHLGLSQLPNINHATLKKQITTLRDLNTLQRINYSLVRDHKDIFLREYFMHHATDLRSSPAYQAFKNNNSWLLGYALFKALKVQWKWQSWEEWPAPWRSPSFITPDDIPTGLNSEVELHMFVQFLCFQQMEVVKRYATSHNIFIKGDIPILINRESADVWLNRKLFLLQYAAGAPPDMYAEEGQKWGFPLYNWQALEHEFYQWWIERLQVASRCYHIYRIDHIVGFYRIWGIPQGCKPKEGLFIPEDTALWIPQGDAIMRMMINNCTMLPIGEDLGTIPPEVRTNLASLGICGTKVMRWERRWLTDGGFIDPKNYPLLSMTTVSTHDSETLQQWWINQPEEASLYANTLEWTYTPELTKQQRIDILKASHNSGSIFHINLLQEYLPLVPNMTWQHPEDERINIPGTLSDLNWTYRFKPCIEDIVQSQPLKHAMMTCAGS